MAADAFAEWLARGRAHQQEGRPADAIPCFRRAAREDPASPVPHFHLGEAWWQLGLPQQAAAAWGRAAALDPSFVAPRLAICEASMLQGDFATATRVASEAVRAVPDDARSRTTLLVARAAAGDEDALASLPASSVASLPTYVLPALAERGVAMPDAIAGRRFTPADVDALRRVSVAVRDSNPTLSERLAVAYGALGATRSAPSVPLMWPVRTRGASLRLAWLLPPVESRAFARARDALTHVLDALPRESLSLVILSVSGAQATRDRLDPRAVDAALVELPAIAGIEAAKVVAARDCDVLVDAAGLAAPVAGMLLAKPARAVWALDTGAPLHRAPAVERVFASTADLVDALRGVPAHLADGDTPAADALAQSWDDAVRLHQQGDLEGAAAGYAQVLERQPGYAPALQLSGVVAAARGDAVRAKEAFAAALAAVPSFTEARLAAADLALADGDTALALSLVHEGLARVPYDAALLRMLGRVHLRRHDGVAAEAAFADLLKVEPASANAHFHHGVALQRKGDAQGAARAYQRALTFDPSFIDADFNLGVLFEQQGNRRAAEGAYRHVIATDPRHVAAYKHLGELLLASGEIDRWLENFHAFEKHCPDALPLAVYALEACQHEGDLAAVDRYLDGLRRDAYRAQDEQELADCLESLLYLLLFYDIEPSTVLRFAQAYDAVAAKVYGMPLPPRPRAQRAPGPLRIGYLSGDLRNHVMGKMMWAAIEHHDRSRFALHFYSTTAERDAWTQRFESVAARFATVAGMDDRVAAAAIAADDLDLLVDLSTHTKGSRPGILAHKPARVQVTHVASAGTVGLSQVDYKLTDRYADVPESQEFQIERLLAMEGCVYPYRPIAAAKDHAFRRETSGIAPDAFVIGAFVNPLKLSRRCLKLWRDVLERIPRAAIAFSPANPAMRASYLRIAAAGGIDAKRIVFIPQGRDDAENQARYAMVDIVLDTMPFGGVNGTLEALDASVPVVTLVGKRHGERTTYSILENLGVTETIARTGREYVDIAVRLAGDAAFMRGVKDAITRGITSSPLTDMKAHTRHLEAAYLAAIG